MLFATGIRVHELCELEIGDYDKENQALFNFC